MNQKRFMILFLAVALILSFSMDYSFVVSYVPMVSTILALSTISYDYNDNGLSFIMTLPNRRGDYAVAKYIFSISCVAFMWLVSIIIQVALIIIQKSDVTTSQVIMTDALMLPMFLLILSVMLPIELKYSPEKARVALFIIFGVVMLIVLGGKSIAESLSSSGIINVDKIVAGVQNIDGPIVIIAAYAASIVVLSISMVTSIRIMQNKEF
jgi:ABC-type transport system involved in multi-copper enzyme maturation permease subunit